MAGLVRLGTTDREVLPIGLGTWSWGDRGDWEFGRTHDDADLRDAFLACTAHGPPLVDTAEGYGGGESERFVGRFLRETGRAAVVATKFSPTRWQLRRADLFRALRGSLERLGRSRIDLYQLHWPTRLSSVEDRMEAFAAAVEEGLVAAIGVANFSLAQVLRAHDALARRQVHLTSVQVEYSLLQRSPERDGLLDACAERGITVLAYSPLASGVLSGKYTPMAPPPGGRGRRYTPEVLARIAPLLELLRALASTHEATPAAVALAWLRAKGALPIPGAKTGRQARENLAGLALELAPGEVEALGSAAERCAR